MKSYRNQQTVRSSDRARSIIIKSTAMMHIAIQEQLDGKTVD
ncbi:MAG: hypothetical protein V7K62_16910 [Nostoc sp.]